MLLLKVETRRVAGNRQSGKEGWKVTWGSSIFRVANMSRAIAPVGSRRYAMLRLENVGLEQPNER